MRAFQLEGNAAPDAAPRVDEVQPAPHIFTLLSETFEDETINANTTNSIFELKGGMRAQVFKPRTGTDPVAELQPLFKKAKKALAPSLQTKPNCTLAIHSAPQTLKKVKKSLAKALDSSLLTEFPLPDGSTDDWVNLVHNPFWIGVKQHAMQVGVGHMCCIEARLIFSGTLLVAGIEYDSVPGKDLKEKRKYVLSASIEAYKALIKEHGFIFKAEPHTGFALPTGFIVMMVAQSDVHALRWTVASDQADTARVITGLKNVLQSFPDMGNASQGYQQLLDLLSID